MNKPIKHANMEQVAGHLDGAQGKEVMRLLARRNENGMAIITVTYSPAYAEYGNRIIHLFDGLILTNPMKG